MALPPSQHQHCTDEAQKAETVLSAVSYIYALYPYISMHIPYIVLYTFPEVLILRLFLLIKWFFYSW